MNNSCLKQTNTRTALTARSILSINRRGRASALVFMLALAVGMLVGNSRVQAQEQLSNAAPVASAAAKPDGKSAAKPAASSTATKVNINSADAKTLADTLKGVGETRAQEIVRYREAYGPFASADELMEVKGIGQSTLDMNRDLITLE